MDFLEEVLRQSRREPWAGSRAARKVCEREGHPYQVVGRLNPTRVQCPRCKVRWAIGPRTEPEGA
jgi:hypothetical protein